ncbi:hypothetical protein [Paracoccus tegillarcae]|uniref:Uncharacterized protein n=1 Tax=Paracoccus tegillarcae TaxID=1529068 RepID=A0A2K9F0U4_9RHOB|nr:hypothetical protein [Paracoccus tegillarcae]AUH33982.1 hypothetical protein CUV01_11780 [Paracoccus tegillarcae]
MTSLRTTALAFMIATGLAILGGSGLTHSHDDAAAAAEPRKDKPIAVGDVLSAGQLHIITEPGLYGLGRKVGKSEYAVSGGQLIRVDPKTLKVLSILRAQSEILD